MHVTTAGTGKQLLLVHGVGSNSRIWRGLMPALAATREVIAVDLPGHGKTPAGAGDGTFGGVVASLEAFLTAERLGGVDMVGSSLGGRLVLELARRGRAGALVALDPGGFWAGFERTYLQTTLLASVFMLRALQPTLPLLAHNPATRSMLLAQLCARPWQVSGDEAAAELDSYVRTETFAPLVNDLAAAPMQEGPAAPPSRPIAIGWGRHDRLCWPIQAERARAAFPSARLHWFEHSGHLPMWDEPEDVVRLIRETVG